MSPLDASGMISKWQREYPIVSHVDWKGYENLGASTLGITRYDLDMTPAISLHTKLENHPIWAMSVLWHEFAHAAAYYESGTPQAHGDKWKGWLWKKPILALINCLCPEPKLLRGQNSSYIVDMTANMTLGVLKRIAPTSYHSFSCFMLHLGRIRTLSDVSLTASV